MSLEIERKWRVQSLPTLTEGARIQQGYLAVGEDEVRVRNKNGAARLTIKRGQGMVREEVEVSITPTQFAALWPLTKGRRVEKTRYVVDYKGIAVEVDVFEGHLAGLMVAEVEFSNREAAEAFAPADWFGEELTGASEWSNARLALDGVPKGEA